MSQGVVEIRELRSSDLPIFFDIQLDSTATDMAAAQSRDRATFMKLWSQLLEDKQRITRTILFDGAVVGYIRSFDWAGKREVGYWIERAHWGKGIATRALSAFLDEEPTRPLNACVAKRNPASVRVLEKCGFRIIGEDAGFTQIDGVDVAGYILELPPEAPGSSSDRD